MSNANRHAWQKRIEARAERLGATVDWSIPMSLTLDAPAGQVWSCDDLHGLVAVWAHTKDRFEALRDLWDRVAYGLEACPFEDCDVCEEQS